ncbi:MAG: SEC-C metal-binding domain-containing protein, partial [Actinomycetes bacterium]
FNLEVEVEAPAAADAGVSPDDSMPFAVAPEIHAKGLDEEHVQAGLQYSAPTLDGGGDGGTATQVTATTATTATAKDGQYAGTPRNAPCPCGSGKKYKKCHGAPGRA